MSEEEYRTVSVKNKTKKRLIDHCRKDETFDQVLNRLLDLDDLHGRPIWPAKKGGDIHD